MDRLLIAMAAAVALLSACGDKEEPFQLADGGGAGDAASAGAITWELNVKPFVEKHCLSCHSEKNQGPSRLGAPPAVNFSTYEQAKQNAPAGSAAVLAGRMPPGGIPQGERDILQRWINAGYPEK
ncbi:MAG: hypothetical protein GMKNLPBB_00305 [Myxococcota bacterium]|nr:hypothetical protein [Myxococcota bacterium]